MNDLTRASHDEEIERLHDKLSRLEPDSEEYSKIFKHYDMLVKSANEDDKIQAEARAEELRIDADADKMREEANGKKRRDRIDLILGTATCVTSIGMSVLTLAVNLIINKRILVFEENGYSLTSKSDRHQVPMPKHKI